MRVHLPAALLAAVLPLPLAAADPADPAAPVPGSSYRSVLEDLPKGVEEGSVDWKAANTEVGRFPRGHIDLLKWEQSQGGARAPAAAASAPAPAARPAAPGHAH